MNQDSQSRLREHPVSRFDGDQHLFDLNQLSEQLSSEQHAATDGHRQIAFYHYGSVTKVLIAFEAGGNMEEHQANGVVSIHVLEGELEVNAQSESHLLQDGQILILAPNVPHSVRANRPGKMLLTVHLHGGKHDDAPHRDPERDTTERTP